MQLENSFHVPLPVDEAWRVLLDAERSVPCMPGARLDSASGDDCTGSIKVKLGPINLTYQGTATITEKDEAAHRAVIDARGKDQRGNGTAAAVFTATLAADGDTTRVDVVTDLTVTGRPAQFGRGVMTDVADKMLTQFAEKLAAQLGAPAPAPAAPRPVAAAAATAIGVVEEIAASVEQVPGDGAAATVVKKAAAAAKKAAASATEKVTEPVATPARKAAPAKKAAAAKPEKTAPARKTAAATSAPAKAAAAKAAPAKAAPAKAAPAKAGPAKAGPAKAGPAKAGPAKPAAAKKAAPAEVAASAHVAPVSGAARRPSGPPTGPSAPPARPATGAPVRNVPSSNPRPAPATPARPEPIDLLEVSAGGPGRYAPAVGAVAAVVAVVLLVRRRRRRR